MHWPQLQLCTRGQSSSHAYFISSHPMYLYRVCSGLLCSALDMNLIITPLLVSFGWRPLHSSPRTTTWSSMMMSSTMPASVPVPERWRWWGWAFCHPPSMVVVLWERPPSPPLRCLRPRCICSVYRPQSPSLATDNRAGLELWMIILLCWGKRLATTYGWMTGMQIARLLTILGIYGVIVHLRPEAQQYHCNHRSTARG